MRHSEEYRISINIEKDFDNMVSKMEDIFSVQANRVVNHARKAKVCEHSFNHYHGIPLGSS